MNKQAAYFLCTKRLGFRLWRKDDFEIALGLWGDFAVTRLIDARGQLSNDQVRQKLQHEIASEEAYGVQYWPIFLLSTGEHIGCCGLRPNELSQGIYEIGFHICSQQWGHGFASEAARGVIEFAFENLAVKTLFAGHNPRNATSRKLLEKLGFRYTHDEYYEPTGLNHPSYLFTKEDYTQNR